MNRVIWGMPSSEEMDSPKPRTEYTGCIVGPLTPKWHCDVCGSQVIPELNPKSGMCLYEAPQEISKAINSVVSRLNQLSGQEDNSDPAVQVLCPARDPENYSQQEIDAHENHGDCLRVVICGCQDFDLFLDGTVAHRQVELESLYHGDLEEQTATHKTTFEPMQNLAGNLSDLLFGNEIFSELVDLIGEAKVAGCKRDFVCEDSQYWDLIADFWVNRSQLFPGFWLERNYGKQT